MASRKNYNIRIRLKYTKGFKNKIFEFYILINSFFKRKYERKLIIKDNIITPFNRLVTCRIKDHTFIKTEENYYWCTRCGFHLISKDYEQYTRTKKIKRLIKKTKN